MLGAGITVPGSPGNSVPRQVGIALLALLALLLLATISSHAQYSTFDSGSSLATSARYTTTCEACLCIRRTREEESIIGPPAQLLSSHYQSSSARWTTIIWRVLIPKSPLSALLLPLTDADVQICNAVAQQICPSAHTPAQRRVAVLLSQTCSDCNISALKIVWLPRARGPRIMKPAPA